MSRIAIVFGLLLCALTTAGMMVSQKMPSLFFPMMLGIPILFCGVVGLNPHRRRHAMQAAALIALVGMLAGGSHAALGALRTMNGAAVNPTALRMVAGAGFLCLAFLLLTLSATLRRSAENRRLSALSRSKSWSDSKGPAPASPANLKRPQGR
ncbi:hypothetical protein [Novipirellula artificiosorum]|uniref:Uncharacterized protein n=1 Tax=Novipirellula artificiosorum TaxID=2528016 RepID=A0A5C6D801_9BACT|nr:hypothetical protein [Novipirellula artificiosorum]TWU32888.1 hypothetical protein Poly41_52660 [Novipirellula artificiosorum]